MRVAIFALGLVLTTATVFACSDDESTPSSPGSSTSSSSGGGSTSSSSSGGSSSGSTSSSSGSTSSSSSGGSSSGDAGNALNGCSTFVDRTAGGASRVLQWDLNLGTKPERCMKIKKGQKVVLSKTADVAGAPGDFTVHPVESKGGDSPSPFETAFDDAKGEVTFDATGTFGFICGVHPSMTGAILVEQ